MNESADRQVAELNDAFDFEDESLDFLQSEDYGSGEQDYDAEVDEYELEYEEAL